MSVRVARLLGATALTSVFAVVALPASFAQSIEDIAQSRVTGDGQMLLEADTLVYDNDRQTVTAVGEVRIDYDGNRLVAQRVSYDRKSGRLIAAGNVEIVDSQGTKVSSDEVDVTDDFRDGFVSALRVETADKTYFGAESAQRQGGVLTTFNRGVYTACAPCEDDPQRPPLWRIKAQKIIWNGEAKTVRFERARFEMFGLPLATLPAFEIADPTVKRKTGFLFPGIRQSSGLGYGVTIPFYLALAPTYDLTLKGSGYSKQGFLAEAQWRQRFDTGEYSVTIAGIRQLDPDAFGTDKVDGTIENRGMIGTKGYFQINPRWAFGWDAFTQTDKNFSRRYNIEGYTDYIRNSQVFLTGLNDRNYFDLRANHFDVQEDALDTDPNARDSVQPWVLPTFDYSVTPDEPLMGGELNIDVNARGIFRERFDGRLATPIIQGVEGTSVRGTAEAEWRRQVIAPGGFVVQPLLAAQTDVIGFDPSDVSTVQIQTMANTLGVESDIRSAYYRAMATAGMEVRWPVLFSLASATHVLEPVAQVFVRPNEAYAGDLGIPNEDAQSMVFDASTLFERDKFSGYDRVEGGTRSNFGLRYSGVLSQQWTANGLFGASYQIAGRNSFASPDLVNVGAYSGLESRMSDYVGMVGLSHGSGFAISAGGRFDEETWEVRRAEAMARYSDTIVSVAARYAYIQGQPLTAFPLDRRELTLTGSTRVTENWKAFGSGTYDFESQVLVARSLGISYEDECFTYAMSYMEGVNSVTNEKSKSIGFNISFRTLGDIRSN